MAHRYLLIGLPGQILYSSLLNMSQSQTKLLLYAGYSLDTAELMIELHRNNTELRQLLCWSCTTVFQE